MYSKEFCLTVANSRTEQDPEAARVIKWLLDAIEETEAAARALKERVDPTRTAVQWLQTLINSPAVEWNPDQRAAAQAAHDAALVAVGPYVAPPPIADERKAAEAEYSTTAFNYPEAPVARTGAEFVDGDLFELDPETLHALKRRHYGPVLKCNVPPSGWECSRPKGHPGPCAATESAGGPDHG